MFGPVGMVSARRLRALIEGLPLESRTARELGAHKPGEATGAELLALDLAAITAELVSGSNYLFVKAHTKKGTRVPDPLKIPRTWRATEDDGPKRQSTPDEVRAFFGARMTVRYSPKEG